MCTCGLNSLDVYLNDIILVKIHDIWEGNMTTMSVTQTKNICSLGFQDIRERAKLRRLILWGLEYAFMGYYDVSCELGSDDSCVTTLIITLCMCPKTCTILPNLKFSEG